MSQKKKTVRFADVSPQTPSPASTSSTLASSPGPITPPQLAPRYLPPTVVRPAEHPPTQQPVPTFVHMPIPMAFIPSPSHNPTRFEAEPEGDLDIDPLLLSPLHAAHPPPLVWDIAEHPDAIKLGSIGSPRARPLSHADLASCAVRKNAKGSPMILSRVLLVCPGLPLALEIIPEERPAWTSTPLPYLTVGDILFGLYKGLRESVKPREYDALGRAEREAVRRAFERRLQADRANYDRNMRYGVRRIDYLGERRQLVGLRPAVGQEIPAGRRRGEVFVVNLAFVR